MSAVSATSGVAAIEARGVTFGYSRRQLVLDGLDLTVPAGSTTVLLGANGAGKTTLLRLLAGLLEPRQGSVRVLGLEPIRDRRRVTQRMGFVPDAPDAWPWMRVPELLAFLAAHHARWDAALAADLVARFAVPTDRPFRALSRGEATKAMLVATLAHRPEVLLLDEPFGGLDPLAHEEVLRAVVEAIAVGEKTVLVSTHDLDVAARLGDRVVVLADGRIRRDVPMDAALDVEGSRRESLRALLRETVDCGKGDAT